MMVKQLVLVPVVMVEVHLGLDPVRVQQVQLMEHQQRELVVVLGVIQILEAQAVVEIVEELTLVELLEQLILVVEVVVLVVVLVELVVAQAVQV